MPARKLNDAQGAEVAELRRQGATVAELAEMFSVSEPTVRSCLAIRRASVPAEEGPEPARIGQELTEDEVIRARQLLGRGLVASEVVRRLMLRRIRLRVV